MQGDGGTAGNSRSSSYDLQGCRQSRARRRGRIVPTMTACAIERPCSSRTGCLDTSSPRLSFEDVRGSRTGGRSSACSASCGRTGGRSSSRRARGRLAGRRRSRITFLTGARSTARDDDGTTRRLWLIVARRARLGARERRFMVGRRLIAGRQALGVEFDIRNALYAKLAAALVRLLRPPPDGPAHVARDRRPPDRALLPRLRAHLLLPAHRSRSSA